MVLRPSFANGFAPRDGQAIWPELWRGCVGAWNPGLGPTGTRLYDWSPYKNHGTLTNMDAGTDWVTNQGRYVLDFDGSNDVVVVLNTLQQLNGLQTFSMSCWGFFRRFNQFPTLWTFTNNINDDSGLLETNNTGSQIYAKTANNAVGLTGARTYTLSSALVANTWNHFFFAKTGSGNNGFLYVNGVLQTSFTGALQDLPATMPSQLRIGCYAQTGAPLDGLATDYQLYNRALSPAEIRLLATRRGIAYELAPRRWSAAMIEAYRRRTQYSQLVGGGII
jgi:hypothetical protein